MVDAVILAGCQSSECRFLLQKAAPIADSRECLPEASRPRKWAQPTGSSIQSDQPDFLPEACGRRAHSRREGYAYSQAASA
jgi:hypothetical protein